MPDATRRLKKIMNEFSDCMISLYIRSSSKLIELGFFDLKYELSTKQKLILDNFSSFKVASIEFISDCHLHVLLSEENVDDSEIYKLLHPGRVHIDELKLGQLFTLANETKEFSDCYFMKIYETVDGRIVKNAVIVKKHSNACAAIVGATCLLSDDRLVDLAYDPVTINDKEHS